VGLDSRCNLIRDWKPECQKEYSNQAAAAVSPLDIGHRTLAITAFQSTRAILSRWDGDSHSALSPPPLPPGTGAGGPVVAAVVPRPSL
jgi:hypothetical protein